MELYLGHGIGFNDPGAPWGTERIGIMGHQGGLYNTYRVPFQRSIRITGQLADDEEQESPPFWWIIRGTENLPVEVGGVRLPESARVKLYRREGYTGKPLEEFDLVNTSGSGALYQVTMAARSTNLRYMEAVVRGYFKDRLRLTARVGEAIGERVFFDPQETTYWTYVWTYEW